jgi:hypothetical protein
MISLIIYCPTTTRLQEQWYIAAAFPEGFRVLCSRLICDMQDDYDTVTPQVRHLVPSLAIVQAVRMSVEIYK